MSQVKAKQLEGVHADQLLDNFISAIVDPTVNDDVSNGYKPSSVWVNTVLDKVFVCSDNSIGAAKWIEIKESSGASLTVTQALHGYSLCEVLKFNGTSYVRAQSDVQANVGIWLITKIIDANTFVISTNGYFTGLTGGTTNTTGFLSSTTPGGLVTTAPAILQPIIYWTSATTGWVLGYPSSQAAVAPSSTPLGYNDLRVSFIGSNWDYEGLTNNGGGISLSGSIAVSGAAGWRYLVVDPTAVVSVETIPPAEIVADTQQYSPTPIFNVANNGYYSSVNPTYRIIAIGYFDVANLLEARAYGIGKIKNDNYWKAIGSGSPIYVGSTGDRLQFTDTFQFTKGTGITCVDNGAGNGSDSFGFRITANENNDLDVEIVIATTSQPALTIQVYKLGSPFCYLQSINLVGIVGSSTFNLYNFSDSVNAGDFFTFVQISNTSGSSSIVGVKAIMRY